MKAQASAEYVILIAVLLVVFLIVATLFFNLYGELNSAIKKQQLENFINTLSSSSKKVYSQGPGARELIFLDQPEFDIDFENSKIENKTICLKTKKFGDFCQGVNFEVEGYLKNGSYYLIENIQNKIRILPSTKLYYSKPGFYFNFTPQNSTIEIVNYGQINLTLNQTIFVNNCINCDYNASGIRILGGGERLIGLVIIPSLSSGIYNGYLEIRATNNLNYANHTIILPITIEQN
ncbi:MAG: hypothetical protein QXV83_02315 [Candidatus Anstonellaceae archaeon]